MKWYDIDKSKVNCFSNNKTVKCINIIAFIDVSWNFLKIEDLKSNSIKLLHKYE